MPRMDKLSSYATTIASRNGTTTVTYHSTPIVEFDLYYIVLRTGGWDSVTTRRKMNQAARQFGLPYSVFRQAGQSYVQIEGGPKLELCSETGFSRPKAAHAALADYAKERQARGD